MAPKRAQLTDDVAMASLDAGGILDRIGDSQPRSSSTEVQEIPLAQIQPNPLQPRQHFSEESLEELAASIREHGFYGHLLVRKKGRIYQLAYGERRLRAAKRVGLETLPVQVRELTDNQMMEIALTENVLREDLHPVEEARAYAQLQSAMGYSVREIGARIGKSKSYVGSLLSILRYPDVEEAVRSADIPVRTAEELAKIEDAEERHYFIDRVIAGKLDREGLIAARKRGHARASVRNADRQPAVKAIGRAYQTLEQQGQRMGQVQPHERAEAIELLQRIIERASQLLAEIEKDQPTQAEN